MTLCIGALMRHDYGDRIGLCFDTKISATDGEYASETQYKFRFLSDEICCLFAGKVSMAKELALAYEDHLRQVALTPHNLVEELQKPVFRIKRRLAETYVQRRWAVSYVEFRKQGAGWLGEHDHRHHLRVIEKHKLGVELIFAGFLSDRTPVLA